MVDKHNIAKQWVDENVVLAEHCDIEYVDLYKSLEILLDQFCINPAQQKGETVLMQHNDGSISGRGKSFN
jgi:hypothetical protein